MPDFQVTGSTSFFLNYEGGNFSLFIFLKNVSMANVLLVHSSSCI